MVLKRLLAGIGFGGASVETRLDPVPARPGGAVHGTVLIEGGDVGQEVEELTVGLQAAVEAEIGDDEVTSHTEFHRIRLGGRTRLSPKQRFEVPFALPVPWEAPITFLHGRPLPGMRLGVNTRLAVANAVDPGDLDPVAIEPLPAQQAVLAALDTLGFRFAKADLERGRIARTRQRLPFYQEVEYYAPSRYRGLNQLELSFVTDEYGMDVVLELDKKPGLFSEGRDTFKSFNVTHGQAAAMDWPGELDRWISALAGRRDFF